MKNESKTDSGCSPSILDPCGTDSEHLVLVTTPEYSDWGCWIMGDYKGRGSDGATVYYPYKNNVPNWFHRKMQELCFGFQWRKK